MNIYLIRFLTKDGAVIQPIKTDDREDIQEIRGILAMLEDSGDIRDADVIPVTEQVSLTPSQWVMEMEKSFGPLGKGRPDASRVDERLDKETETMVRDLLVSAFEGGSNYWYRIESKKLPPGTKEKDFKEGGRMQDADQYYHPMQIIPTIPGGQLVIRDVSEGLGETAILDLGALKRGLILLKEKYPRIWKRAMEGTADAADGDVYLQLSLFGKVIFG